MARYICVLKRWNGADRRTRSPEFHFLLDRKFFQHPVIVFSTGEQPPNRRCEPMAFLFISFICRFAFCLLFFSFQSTPPWRKTIVFCILRIQNRSELWNVLNRNTLMAAKTNRCEGKKKAWNPFKMDSWNQNSNQVESTTARWQLQWLGMKGPAGLVFFSSHVFFWKIPISRLILVSYRIIMIIIM